MKLSVWIAASCAVAFVFLVPTESQAEEPYQVTQKAWAATGKKNWDRVISLAADSEATAE